MTAGQSGGGDRPQHGQAEAGIRFAGPADRSAVIDTVLTAFVADPAFGFFFPTEYRTRGALFVGYLFDKRIGSVWMTAAAEAVALWSLPTGDLDLPFDWSRLGDSADRIHHYESVVESLLPEETGSYLGVIATRPEYQGQGLATRLIRAGVERAAGVPSFLETTNPLNLGLYGRMGWEVIGEATVVPGLIVWVLRHPGEFVETG